MGNVLRSSVPDHVLRSNVPEIQYRSARKVLTSGVGRLEYLLYSGPAFLSDKEKKKNEPFHLFHCCYLEGREDSVLC